MCAAHLGDLLAVYVGAVHAARGAHDEGPRPEACARVRGGQVGGSPTGPLAPPLSRLAAARRRSPSAWKSVPLQWRQCPPVNVHSPTSGGGVSLEPRGPGAGLGAGPVEREELGARAGGARSSSCSSDASECSDHPSSSSSSSESTLRVEGVLTGLARACVCGRWGDGLTSVVGGGERRRTSPPSPLRGNSLTARCARPSRL